MANPQAYKRFLVSFTVEGSGDFPFDMLRYDGAFPASERDSSIIANEHGHRRVNLQAWVEQPHSSRVPTARRWESFLWKVVV